MVFHIGKGTGTRIGQGLVFQPQQPQKHNETLGPVCRGFQLETRIGTEKQPHLFQRPDTGTVIYTVRRRQAVTAVDRHFTDGRLHLQFPGGRIAHHIKAARRQGGILGRHAAAGDIHQIRGIGDQRAVLYGHLAARRRRQHITLLQQQHAFTLLLHRGLLLLGRQAHSSIAVHRSAKLVGVNSSQAVINGLLHVRFQLRRKLLL